MTQASVTDVQREAFEAWAETKGYYFERREIAQVYVSPRTHHAWIGWQAALSTKPKAVSVPMVTITAEAFNFIMGIGAMDGRYFGEPDDKGHAFWWRHKILPTAIIGEGD